MQIRGVKIEFCEGPAPLLNLALRPSPVLGLPFNVGLFPIGFRGFIILLFPPL